MEICKEFHETEMESNGISNGEATNTPENKGNKLCSSIKNFLSTVTESMNISVLKNPVFDIYAFSCVLCMAGKHPFYI